MKIFPLHLIPNDTRIDFMRLRGISLLVALLLAVAAVAAIAYNQAARGSAFNYALDFTGGVGVELHFGKPPGVDAVRERLAAAGFDNAQVQTYGTGSDILVRLQDDGRHAARTGTVGAAQDGQALLDVGQIGRHPYPQIGAAGAHQRYFSKVFTYRPKSPSLYCAARRLMASSRCRRRSARVTAAPNQRTWAMV